MLSVDKDDKTRLTGSATCYLLKNEGNRPGSMYVLMEVTYVRLPLRRSYGIRPVL